MKSEYAIIGLALATLLSAQPRPANSRYAGTQICARCHQSKVESQTTTAMAHALQAAGESEIVGQNPKLTFHEGRYSSQIMREEDRSILTVTDGVRTLSVPLKWSFGSPEAGQTYLFERNGAFYETRVTFFTSIGKLDVTPGMPSTVPNTLEEALGQRMSATHTRECFACHSTGAVRGGRLQVEAAVPGVTCENCHGPALKHVAAVDAGRPSEARMRRLATLNTEQISELCGSCHRTWQKVALMPIRGIQTLRFQPYRLTNSKCYSATDRRISCVACHDPHQKLEHRSVSYDKQCLTCHAPSQMTRRKSCPVSKQDCVTCHMPKFEVPGTHTRFTDHQIRIARPGEPVPP